MNNTVIYTTWCDNKTVCHVRPQLDSQSVLFKIVIALHTSLSDAQYLEVNLS